MANQRLISSCLRNDAKLRKIFRKISNVNALLYCEKTVTITITRELYDFKLKRWKQNIYYLKKTDVKYAHKNAWTGFRNSPNFQSRTAPGSKTFVPPPRFLAEKKKEYERFSTEKRNGYEKYSTERRETTERFYTEKKQNNGYEKQYPAEKFERFPTEKSKIFFIILQMATVLIQSSAHLLIESTKKNLILYSKTTNIYSDSKG